ncbi:LOW QUALITY PROTEIN: phthalate transporter [Colletotrichum tofieldiae]|nr:LOW QUALITY PROTEIN: phthalate transporter [Colletotrichum tofieldiae]
MATVLAKDPFRKDEDGQPSISLEGAPPLGAPIEEKRFWFQRNKSYDPFATATQYLTANTDNMLGDLGMTTNDYNLGNTVFKLAFLCAELPSQLVSKWVGPDRWIPAQMVLWSIVASCQFWLSGRDSFLACRALLGLLQGGFIPDVSNYSELCDVQKPWLICYLVQVILYLSYFYKHHELSLRLGFFWTAMSIADILSAILAYGILHMRGLEGHAGWRWLFLVEGLLTLVIGIFGFLLMPAGPCQTVSWFRGKNGWFTERQASTHSRSREEIIMVNRVLREDPSKSSMHNREPITPSLLWDSLKDYDLWPLYILGLTFQIPMTPPSQYLTLTLRNLGFDTFQANLLAIPYTVGHMITMLAITYLGEIIGELTFVSMSGQVWALPFLIYLNVVNTSEVNRWVLYAVITLLLMYPNRKFSKTQMLRCEVNIDAAHPIQLIKVGWNSRNSNTVRSRTVSAACYNMFVQTSGIISSNIYRSGFHTLMLMLHCAYINSDDAPLYKRGNQSLLGIVCMNLVLYPLVKSYYVYRNKKRDKTWNGMSEAQRLAYLETTKDEGNKRLDFRFSH